MAYTLSVAVFVKGQERTGRPLYLKRPLLTALNYQRGAGFALYHADGTPWSGTIYSVVNCPCTPADESVCIDVSVDPDTFEKLRQDAASWTAKYPDGDPAGSPSKIRHLQLVPKEEKPEEE